MNIGDLIRRIRFDNATNILIAINVGIFLVVKVSQLVLMLFNVDFEPVWLELSSSPGVVLRRPWSIATYAFLHTGFLHILFNMLALVWFGRIAEQHYSRGQVWAIYLLGGVAGGLLFLLAFNTLPYFVTHFAGTSLLGASASVLAVTVAAAMAEPERELRFFLIGGVRLKWLAVIMIVISFLGVTGSNGGGDIAHLGGAAMGAVYALLARRVGSSRRWSGPRIRRERKTAGGKGRFHFRRGTPDIHTEDGHDAAANPFSSDPDYRRNTAADQAEIDRVLAKVRRSGYASLTEDEKQLLFHKH